MTTLAGRVANALTPYLGPYSAGAVALHLCAKYATDGEANRRKLGGLRDFLRRVLAAYVGAEEAQEIAGRCIHPGTTPILRGGPQSSAASRRTATELKGTRTRKRRSR
jgi:hypothetical protein